MGRPEASSLLELLQRAQAIYDEFIKDKAERQINLPSHLTRTITQDLQAARLAIEEGRLVPLSHVFEAAHLAIFTLVEKDSFPRFMKGEHYEQLITDSVAALRVEDLGAKWMPDTSTRNCMACGVAFSLIQRKHHCRLCGSVVCAACSPRLRVVDHSNRPLRVCVKCENEANPYVMREGLLDIWKDKHWRSRYCVVTREKFLLFARADDKQCQFELGLANVDRVLPLDDDRKHHSFALEVREDEISLHLVMSVPSSQARSEWVTAIHDALLNIQEDDNRKAAALNLVRKPALGISRNPKAPPPPKASPFVASSEMQKNPPIPRDVKGTAKQLASGGSAPQSPSSSPEFQARRLRPTSPTGNEAGDMLDPLTATIHSYFAGPSVSVQFGVKEPDSVETERSEELVVDELEAKLSKS